MIRRTFKPRSKHICIRRDHIRVYRMAAPGRPGSPPAIGQSYVCSRRQSSRDDLNYVLSCLGVPHRTINHVMDIFFPITLPTPSEAVDAFQQIQPLNAQAPQNPDIGTGTPPGTMHVDITTGEMHIQAGTAERAGWVTTLAQEVTRRPIRITTPGYDQAMGQLADIVGDYQARHGLAHDEWVPWPIVEDNGAGF